MIGLFDALLSVVVSSIRLVDGILALVLEVVIASATGSDERRSLLQRQDWHGNLSRHSDEKLLTQRAAIDSELRMRYRKRMMANVGAIERQSSATRYQDSVVATRRRRRTG